MQCNMIIVLRHRRLGLKKLIYLYYSDCFLSYNFGPEHPLNPIRLSLSCKLIEEEGLLDGKTELVCPPARGGAGTGSHPEYIGQ